MKLPRLCFATLLALLLPSAGVFALTIQVVSTYDYPGATSTTGLGINKAGDIAGHFTTGTGAEEGFIRLASGRFTRPIIDPNDTGNFTVVIDINSARTTSGYYFSSADNFYHGFFLSGSTFTPFDIAAGGSTFITGLTDAGDFCGSYGNGFVQSYVNIGGTTQTFTITGSTRNDALGMNNANQVVGSYVDASGNSHGFLRAADGTLTYPLDYPGATTTILFDINDRGLVVGRYIDASGVLHGLVLKLPGTFISYDYPGASETSFDGINATGTISARYSDSAGVRHGFIARVR